jgi:hypothetical protein
MSHDPNDIPTPATPAAPVATLSLGDFMLSLTSLLVEVTNNGGSAYQLAYMQRGNTEPRKLLVFVTSGEAAQNVYEELAMRHREQRAAAELLAAEPAGKVQ